LHYMEQAWLSFSVENYAGKLHDKLSYKKYYFIDNGIISLFKEGSLGELLENLVAINLRRKYGQDFYYYKHNTEVDFYMPNEHMAIQVCYSLQEEETRIRETAALTAIHRFIPLKSAIIVTYDEETEFQTDEDLSITVIPIWKWLLLNE
ncbi:MAG: DUF4143 domain-containing protein, partial [Odoribacter sp.]|nr:DUF4143 domain-containing protein [Odoribacter sp.]